MKPNLQDVNLTTKMMMKIKMTVSLPQGSRRKMMNRATTVIFGRLAMIAGTTKINNKLEGLLKMIEKDIQWLNCFETLDRNWH
jgi:hypothetical protein